MKKIIVLLLIFFISFEVVYNSETCKNELTNLLAFFLIDRSEAGQAVIPNMPVSLFVAHAGGSIDGHIYTNSREAVENSLKNGFKFIEIDFLVTSDGHLVAAHDWKKFGEMTGRDTITSLPLEEIKKLNIYNRYHILSGKDITEIMEKHQDMILVTDKIRDISLLEKEISFKKRTLVEVFSRFDYLKCLWYGFTPVYSLPWKIDDLEKIKRLDASLYTLSGIFWEKNHSQLREYAATLCQQGKEILLYTAGSPSNVDMESDDFLKKYKGIYFTKIYTDKQRKLSDN